MNFKETREFSQEFKKLSKKYKTLLDDIVLFKKILAKFPKGNTTKHFNILTKQDNVFVIKARLMCRSLKGKSLRVVYAYIEGENTFKMVDSEFIEIFYKGNKGREDKQRIKGYLEILGSGPQ